MRLTKKQLTGTIQPINKKEQIMVKVIIFGGRKALRTIRDLQIKTDFGRDLADIVNRYTNRPVGGHLPVILVPGYTDPETKVMVQITYPNKFPTKEEDLSENGKIRFLQDLDALFSKYFNGKYEHITMASIELQPEDPSLRLLKSLL
jgi:hypothetical protein